ncbi:hypothetical protein I551_3549 [Mycobacterium ulcerans str. Harvey]|uniref:Uncharacterized protein n=1 Tax=Mycobacterium ulcerans str. Harvey TaxID=1299332 RepID=A0ABN0QYN0_MYCUL|nr:hypothetical protein I551_3549 [Mycobacterium ulcerans str. Harvey]
MTSSATLRSPGAGRDYRGCFTGGGQAAAQVLDFGCRRWMNY